MKMLTKETSTRGLVWKRKKEKKAAKTGKKVFCAALSNSQELHQTVDGVSNRVLDLKLPCLREDEDS